MIRKEDLFNSIQKISREINEEIDFYDMKKLISEINRKLTKKMTRANFTDLVMRESINHKLPYKYCKVAYSYYGRSRKQKAKSSQRMLFIS